MPNFNSIIDIKEFFNRHNGIQRSNRYSVSFVNLPAELPVVPVNDFKCIAATIGSRAIDGVADGLAGYGPGRTVPRSQKFPQGVMLAFPVTTDNFITDFYDKWFNTIYSGGRQRGGDYSTAFQVGYYDQIVAPVQMKINLLDLNGNINRTYTFYEVYPVEALPMELSMMDTNKFATYQVLMFYRDFTFTPGPAI